MIVAVNPGSTSTKVAGFNGEDETFSLVVSHPVEELQAYERVIDQLEMRFETVRSALRENEIDLSTVAAAVGRGGLLRPLASGVYRVTETMVDDLSHRRFGEHASNLGALLAHRIAAHSTHARADGASCPAFIADPVVVDEMIDEARYSGHPLFGRKSIFHALNHKSTAKEVATRIGKPYRDCRFIVAHMGGGVSIGAHAGGRVVDVNNALDGDGPFSPERSGGLPSGQLAELCFSGAYEHDAIKKMLTGRGGLVAYTGTNDLTAVLDAWDAGDRDVGLVVTAMCYQISKEIAAHGATLCGDIDRIILTGGMAYSERIVKMISARVSYLAPIEVLPGEREMISLARAAARALDGSEPIHEY